MVYILKITYIVLVLISSALLSACNLGLKKTNHTLQTSLKKDMNTIAFLGDSITKAGEKENGFCKLILKGLEDQGYQVTGIFAGKVAEKSNQMYGRIQRDVVKKKPDWLVLSCGVNDVYHFFMPGYSGLPLPQYKKHMRSMVVQAQEAKIKVILLTSTMINEDPNNKMNQKLKSYNAFLHELAKEKKCRLFDANKSMHEMLKHGYTKPTEDGVHLSAAGHVMVAIGVLGSLGLDKSSLDKLEFEWMP
jgi:lysophospholipase L1-like esterase